MHIEVIYWGSVEEFKTLEIEADFDEVKILPYPFVEGVRGDYVLVVGIDYEK